MKSIIIAAGALAAAGCVSNQNDLDESFGAAFNANMTAQVIDKTPAEGAPETAGSAVDLATLRYRTDKVKVGRTGEFEAGDDATEEGD